MNLIRLNKKNILDFKELISYFFEHNKESWIFFNPHNPSWSTLNNIIKGTEKDFYGIFLYKNNLIGYGILRGWDEGFEIPSLGIIVDKDFRGKGFGNIIMNKLHQKAKEFGANRVRLTILKENYNAINLYNKLGYKLSELNNKKLIGFKKL